ncbi:MAG TPA: isoaspartyl peptidase/L-asparaginase [Chitinophagaceae bacterium]|nr:isoaspartyl peptidase/L-asparaginase [Chitinophagaceae bacterium]
MKKFGIAIHGGAGTILESQMTAELRQAYENALREALDAGYEVLEKNGTAVDAVAAATVKLEDNLLFNAGRGSVFTRKGGHEMDASIMEGKELKAGAVAGVQHVRNPVALALAVMQRSDHVFLSGEGAEEFALEQGMKPEPASYFFSQFRYDQWKAVRDSDTYALDHSALEVENLMKNKKFGTVGAVALDVDGNLAAATSTGGMTNKKYGRIGDTPVIGSGTYANNRTAAISCTGHGELFLRAIAAYDVSALMEYKGLSLEEAMHEVVMVKLKAIQGEGGMIGIDAAGNISMIFNSEGMYRGVRDSSGRSEIAIFR